MNTSISHVVPMNTSISHAYTPSGVAAHWNNTRGREGLPGVR